MEEWYIIYNNQQVGPMTKEQLLAYNLTPQSLVWKQGMSEWAQIFTIPELMELVSKSPGSCPSNGIAPPAYNQPTSTPVASKSKIVAGILAIMLGGLGIQYFYINKPVGGIMSILLIWIAPLVIGLFTCGAGLSLYLISLVLCVIYFAQGIEMLCLSDEEFNRRFVACNSSWPFF